jgi:dienelactone hydrolase
LGDLPAQPAATDERPPGALPVQEIRKVDEHIPDSIARVATIGYAAPTSDLRSLGDRRDALAGRWAHHRVGVGRALATAKPRRQSSIVFMSA